MSENLTILQFTADNVTNLKAVRITPDKKVIVLTGKNEAGKSNILDVIQSLIEGLKLKMPIREGEDRGHAAIDPDPSDARFARVDNASDGWRSSGPWNL